MMRFVIIRELNHAQIFTLQTPVLMRDLSCFGGKMIIFCAKNLLISQKIIKNTPKRV